VSFVVNGFVKLLVLIAHASARESLLGFGAAGFGINGGEKIPTQAKTGLE
jgi:hypothetical protein